MSALTPFAVLQAAAEYTGSSRAIDSAFERPIFAALEFAGEHIGLILIGLIVLVMFYKLLFD